MVFLVFEVINSEISYRFRIETADKRVRSKSHRQKRLHDFQQELCIWGLFLAFQRCMQSSILRILADNKQIIAFLHQP